MKAKCTAGNGGAAAEAVGSLGSLKLFGVIGGPARSASDGKSPISRRSHGRIPYHTIPFAESMAQSKAHQLDTVAYTKDGHFNRQPSVFRNTIEPGGQFPPEKGAFLHACWLPPSIADFRWLYHSSVTGRYHLYICHGESDSFGWYENVFLKSLLIVEVVRGHIVR